MSFSGLKTAVRRAVEDQPPGDQRRADICASFQAAVADILAFKSARAMEIVAERTDRRTFVVAGGVAANRRCARALKPKRIARGSTSLPRHCAGAPTTAP